MAQHRPTATSLDKPDHSTVETPISLKKASQKRKLQDTSNAALFEIDDKGRVSFPWDKPESLEEQTSTLDVFPQEFHSLIAKLVEGRDSTINALVKDVTKELISTFDSGPQCFTDKALQQAITNSATRINYGISSLQNAPAVTAVWRWETVQNIFDTFETDLKTALLAKRTKRAEAHGALEAAVLSMTTEEKEQLFAKRKRQRKNETTQSSSGPPLAEVDENSVKAMQVETLVEHTNGITPAAMDCSSPNLKAATPAKRRGNVTQAGSGKKKNEVDQSQSRISVFFKPKEMSKPEVTTANLANTEVAPHNLHLPPPGSSEETARCSSMNHLLDEFEDSSNTNQPASIRIAVNELQNARIRHCLRIRKHPNYLWNKSPRRKGNGEAGMQNDSIYEDGTGWFKFLKFSENIRPPWFGTWSKTSRIITGRRPFTQDHQLLQYDIESDLEWEDDEPGEDLKSDDEDDERSETGERDDEEFVVPHGYLSDDEGFEDSALPPNTLPGGRFTKPAVRNMVPAIFGPYLGDYEPPGDVNSPLSKQSIIFFDQELIDPFASHQDGVATKPDDQNSTVTSSTTARGKKPALFPEDKLELLITTVQGSSKGIGKLVDELKDILQDVPKLTIEKMIKEVAVKEKRGDETKMIWHIKLEYQKERKSEIQLRQPNHSDPPQSSNITNFFIPTMDGNPYSVAIGYDGQQDV
ncbi:chromatin assembly factor 1 subunit A-domain-containing protein [Cladochytrium replicatum]|nr:chromatin assembly factor 1 subunit A-domain-containing protein [Cladochytrium replicatum]